MYMLRHKGMGGGDRKTGRIFSKIPSNNSTIAIINTNNNQKDNNNTITLTITIMASMK